MVYCGVVSKGCQRCRQRKIKCDQRKPTCLKCEKSKFQCSGYRDLSTVVFRNESERVAMKVRRIKSSKADLRQGTPIASPEYSQSSQPTSEYTPTTSSSYLAEVPYPFATPIDELGANFFFAKYTYREGPFVGDYHAWLTRSYFQDKPNAGLRAAVEAVGLAGLSNVSHAPHIASKSKEQYCKALNAMTLALNDTVQATADTTLLTVNLLGLFETLNLETWNTRRFWAAHMKAAMALLVLRGQDQFTRERGAQLYVQIRSQILSACMQQHIPVPPALVQSTYDFQTSSARNLWRSRDVASPGSLTEISFRLANLWAAFKNDVMQSQESIRNAALEIDHDLETWTEGITPNWRYYAIDAPEAVAASDFYFEGQSHVYPNLWVARVWNSWRGLRIVVSQVIMQNEYRATEPDNNLLFIAASTIQQLSAEICISVSSFTVSSPDLLSLIESLCHIALEELNTHSVRSFAIKQLRRIDAFMGVRQARLLADTVTRRLCESPMELMPCVNRLQH